MRSAIGNSLLMNLVIIIVTAVILIFVGILSYSKAYRVKNRIIEVIEKYGTYEDSDDAKEEIAMFLKQSGYQLGNCDEPGIDKDTMKIASKGYKYCVETIYENSSNNNDEENKKKYYKVTTYVEFNFPIINSLLKVPVRGETKMLGINYDEYK